MSRPLRVALFILIMTMASVIFMQYNNGNAMKLALAIETPASTQGQSTKAAAEDKLRQLYVERKQILESFLKSIELDIKAGRATRSEYVKAKKATYLAEIDLCNTKSERIKIHEEIVKLYIELEKDEKRRVEAGIIDQQEMDKIRVARLESEIDLLKEQLK